MDYNTIFTILGVLWAIYIAWLVLSRVVRAALKPTSTPKPKPVKPTKPAINAALAQRLQETKHKLDGAIFEVVDNKRHVMDINMICTDRLNEPAASNEVMHIVGERLSSIQPTKKRAFQEMMGRKDAVDNYPKQVKEDLRTLLSKLEKFESRHNDLSEFYRLSREQIGNATDTDSLASEKRVCILGCMKKSKKLLATIEDIEAFSRKDLI